MKCGSASFDVSKGTSVCFGTAVAASYSVNRNKKQSLHLWVMIRAVQTHFKKPRLFIKNLKT